MWCKMSHAVRAFATIRANNLAQISGLCQNLSEWHMSQCPEKRMCL